MAKKLKPVSIAGIEFDALMEEQKTLSATIPTYPVESGFPVSDAIILDPVNVSMTLYVSKTPVTWLYRHGTDSDRVKKICDRLEKIWLKKQLVKVVTCDAIYKSMGMSNITFRKSANLAYAREVQISMQKVEQTEMRTTDIPSYILQSGDTGTNAGAASTSGSSELLGSDDGTGSGSDSGGTAGKSEGSNAKKAQSILYGVASGLGFF